MTWYLPHFMMCMDAAVTPAGPEPGSKVPRTLDPGIWGHGTRITGRAGPVQLQCYCGAFGRDPTRRCQEVRASVKMISERKVPPRHGRAALSRNQDLRESGRVGPGRDSRPDQMDGVSKR